MIEIDLDIGAQHTLGKIENINSEIFRVIEISRLFDLFESELLCLTAPKLWDDPYENCLKHSYGISSGEESVRLSFEAYSKYIFGQCWTLNKETDAIWRIYSPNKDRVKIKTTIAKLQKQIQKVTDQGVLTYIGEVIYLPEDKIRERIADGIKNSFMFHPDTLIRRYYLVKRDTFTYENEVRIIVHLPTPPDNYKNAKYQDPENLDLCHLFLDNPVELIDEIVFDPRMPDSLVRAYTSYLRDNFKFNKDIYKSNIYEMPIIQAKPKYW
jgi:hypothetical protein